MQMAVIIPAVLPHQSEYQCLGWIARPLERNTIQHGMGNSSIKAVDRFDRAFLFSISHDYHPPDVKETDTSPMPRSVIVRQGQHPCQGKQSDCRAFADVPAMLRYSWLTSPCSTYMATLCSLPSSVGRMTRTVSIRIPSSRSSQIRAAGIRISSSRRAVMVSTGVSFSRSSNLARCALVELPLCIA